MKNNTKYNPGMPKMMAIRPQVAVLALVIFCLLFHSRSLAQLCCTNSIVVNTGYDPCTRSALPMGAPASPVTDPKWRVTMLSAANAAYIGGWTGPYQAFVPDAPPGTYILHSGSLYHYISIDNRIEYPTTSGPLLRYNAEFQRTFTLCANDAIVLDFCVEVDWRIQQIWLDATPLIVPGSYTYVSGFTPYCLTTAAMPLVAGTHTITVQLINDAFPYALNGYGFALAGTVSSSSGASSIVAEGPGVISGVSAMCEGDVATFTNSVPCGTWSSSNPTVASVGSGTGIVTAGTGGIANITYTMPDGCFTVFPVTVTSMPAPIGGPDYLCPYATGVYTTTPGGGTWSVAPVSATIGTSGTYATGVAYAGITAGATGPLLITYTVGSCTVTKSVTVSSAPTVTLTQPGLPTPDWVYRISVTGGDCPDYVVNYDLYLNAFTYCGYAGPVHKSALISSGSFIDITYWYLDNGTTTGGAASTPSYTYPYSPISEFDPACDPHDPAATLTVHDWGIYKICLTSVSGCGCNWQLGGCATGKGGPAPDNSLPNELSKLSLTPNPSTGSFTIKGSLPTLKTMTEATIEVADLLGKTVYVDAATVENGNINKVINLGNEVANGVYTIRIRSGEINEVIKFTLDR